MGCHQCGKNAMYTVTTPQGGQIPLCLDCYKKHQELQFQILDETARSLNFNISYMESVTGVPQGSLPRYPLREATVIQSGGIVLNNINVTDSEIGVLNTGVISNLDSTITVIKHGAEQELAQALTSFTEQIIKSHELEQEQKNEVIELLETLTDQIITPEERRRSKLITLLMSQIPTIIQGASLITAKWESIEPMLKNVFGIG